MLAGMKTQKRPGMSALAGIGCRIAIHFLDIPAGGHPCRSYGFAASRALKQQYVDILHSCLIACLIVYSIHVLPPFFVLGQG
jgi:hypothetical protein